jgi:predicted nucleotidyltransferase
MSDEEVYLLDKLVDIITETAEPDQVILFGSRATDTARPGSDYDFLVVVSQVENERHVSRRIYRALLDHHIDAAVDVVVVDREKLERYRDAPGLIYRQALEEGKLAYDRTGG